MYDILPKEIINNLENILGGNFDDIPEEIRNIYIPKLRWIPYKSLGKENGMLLGIKIDGMEVEKEEIHKVQNVIVGIYDKSLTKRGEYRALVGIDMI